MTLSDEGVKFLSKAAIFVVLLLVTAAIRTYVGPNPKRQFGMAIGTVGGIAIGIAMTSTLSAWAGRDVFNFAILAGVFAGWLLAYQFVKHIPRNAPSQRTP